MKQLIVLLIVFGFCTRIFASAPQQRIDSIQNYVNYLVENDSLAKAFSCVMNLANEYQYLGDWEKYDDAMNVMLGYAEEVDDKGLIAETHSKSAIGQCVRGQNKLAVENFLKALEIAIEIKDTLRIANSHENVSIAYSYMGQYENAMHHQMQCLSIREKEHPLNARLPNNYTSISQLWEDMGDTAKQWEYLMKAQKIDNLLTPNHSRSAILCCEIGEALMDKQKYDQAVEYFHTGLKHSEAIGWNRGIATFVGNLALVHYKNGNWQKSKKMHQQCLNMSLEVDNCMSIAQEYKAIAQCHEQLGEIDSAVIMIDKALEKSKACGLNSEYANALYAASSIYQSNNEPHGAVDFLRKYINLNDSILGIETQENIADLETKYETEKKEQQIELLQAENKIKHQEFIASIATTVAVVLMLIIGVLLYLKKRKQNQVHQLVLRQQLLRSQMNPHFLFNALGSIQSFMYKNETKKAAGYLGNFASLTRAILEHSTEEFVPLSAEIETLHNYVKLEQMRVENSFEYKIEYDEDIDTEFINVPPMLIQPFVENAVKHGMKNLDYPGLLTIHFNEIGDKLRIKVTDNGHGINTAKKSDEKATSHRSMSMQIFKERRAILSHRFKKDVRFELIDRSERNEEESGTEVLIVIPV